MPEGIWTELLTQVPIVGAFIYFCIKLVQMFLDFLKQRDIQWQQWLEGQRETDNDTLEKITSKLNDLAQVVSQLKEAFIIHDAIQRASVGDEKDEDSSSTTQIDLPDRPDGIPASRVVVSRGSNRGSGS